MVNLRFGRKLNVNIWNSFLKYEFLRKKNFNREQAYEIDFIEDTFRDCLRSNGLTRTSLHGLRKNELGYDFRRRCTKKKCSGSWYLKVNINEEDAQVFYNDKCDHFKV